MIKLFGEYLLEKKLISKEVLVQALIDQMSGLPSTAAIVFENRLLSTEQLLEVFRLQIENKCGFVEAATTLNLWTADIAKNIDEKLAFVRTPLGQILVKTGSVSLEQVTSALDEFFSEVQVQKTVPDHKENESHDTFSDFLTPTLRKKLDTAFPEGVEGIEEANEIKNAINEVHRLKGAARLVSLEQAGELLENLETLLSTFSKIERSTIKPEIKEKIKNAYFRALELVWKASGNFKNTGDQFGKEFQEVNAQLQMLTFDLGFLDGKKES